MERDNVHTLQQRGHGESHIFSSSGAGAVPLSSTDESGAGDFTDAGCCLEQMEPFKNNIAVFMDQTFRMIESVPNDIVCWSEAGDSFKIKQVGEKGM